MSVWSFPEQPAIWGLRNIFSGNRNQLINDTHFFLKRDLPLRGHRHQKLGKTD